MCDETTLMETGSCSRRCMPSLRSKATVATGSLRSWLLHGGSESLTGRGASHVMRELQLLLRGSGRSDGVTGSWAGSPTRSLSAHLRTGSRPTVRFTMVGGVLPAAEIIELFGFVLPRLSQQCSSRYHGSGYHLLTPACNIPVALRDLSYLG